jgi:hypothetical protein
MRSTLRLSEGKTGKAVIDLRFTKFQNFNLRQATLQEITKQGAPEVGTGKYSKNGGGEGIQPSLTPLLRFEIQGVAFAA